MKVPTDQHCRCTCAPHQAPAREKENYDLFIYFHFDAKIRLNSIADFIKAEASHSVTLQKLYL